LGINLLKTTRERERKKRRKKKKERVRDSSEGGISEFVSDFEFEQ